VGTKSFILPGIPLFSAFSIFAALVFKQASYAALAAIPPEKYCDFLAAKPF
jgi:hypothetical protein